MEREAEGHGVDLIAVDGGASRCRLAAFDGRGTRLAEVSIDAPASLTLGEIDAWRTIRVGIGRLFHTLSPATRGSAVEPLPVPTGATDAAAGVAASPAVPTPDRPVPDRPVPEWPATLALGLAGALRDERRARLLELVERETDAGVRCRLVTDGYAQLVGASLGRPGVCLAVGTGSVVHWLAPDGRHGMAGGWGFPIGDEGSGAWLGARLLQRYLWHLDGQACGSPLMAALEARLGDSPAALQRLTTDARSTTHARLARLVVEASVSGDALAASLLDEGAEWCLRLVERAPPELPVHVVGGLGAAYASRLAVRLGARLVPARGDALDGLSLIARGAVPG